MVVAVVSASGSDFGASCASVGVPPSIASDANQFFNARPNVSGARIDFTNLETHFENDEDETKVPLLMGHYLSGRFAPDLLPWQGELVGKIF